MADNSQETDQSGGVNFGQGNRSRVGRDAVGRDANDASGSQGALIGSSGQVNQNYGGDRWNERQGSAASNVNVNLSADDRRRDNGSWVERALSGDTYTGYPGLIKEVQELKRAFDNFVRSDSDWKREWAENLESSRRTWITPNVAVLLLALAAAILLLGFYGITVYGK